MGALHAADLVLIAGFQTSVRLPFDRERDRRTLTVTIPASAHVRDDRHKATLAELKPGQRVLVLHGPQQTLVVARDTRNG